MEKGSTAAAGTDRLHLKYTIGRITTWKNILISMNRA
jgi:hypothetical protein